MAQKSILSFFKVSVCSTSNDSEKGEKVKAEQKSPERELGQDECSPVKKTNKRKRNFLDSDDESEEIPNVDQKSAQNVGYEAKEISKQSVKNVSEQTKEKKESPELNSEKPSKCIKLRKEENGISHKIIFNDGKKSSENGELNKSKVEDRKVDLKHSKSSDVRSNSEADDRKKPKIIENDKQGRLTDKALNLPSKMDIDLAIDTNNLLNKSSTSPSISESSTSNGDTVIPRRKTARKSTIRPPAECEWYIAKLKEQEDYKDKKCASNDYRVKNPSNSEKNVIKRFGRDTADSSNNAPIDAEIKESDFNKAELKQLENKEQKYELSSEIQTAESGSTVPKSDNDDQQITAKCSENTLSVKTIEVFKKPEGNKNKAKRVHKKDMKDTTPKKSSSSIANFFSLVTVKEKKENDSKETGNSVTEGSITVETETSIVSHNKDRIVIKSDSTEVETDDSPIKKGAKRQKKTQCIESDDEEQLGPSPKKIKILNEDEDKHNVTSKEMKNDALNNDKNSDDSSNKNLSSKAEGTKTAKETLSCKSTSTRTVYNPSKNNYHPIEDACWKHNEKVPYLALAKTLELIENVSGRLKIIEILANFFRSVIVLSPDDLLQSVYLCLNRLAPEYEGIELGVGETLLMKAVAQATGRSLDKIKAEVAVKGDLGLVSESSRGNQRVMFTPPKLTVSSVFNKFLEIAKMTGNAVMSKKIDKIQILFVACRDCEAKYIIRSLSGKLRIGLAEQSVLAAIARAAVLTPPGQSYPPEIIDASKGVSENSFKEQLNTQVLILKTAYCECPNYDLIVPVLLKEGISALPKFCQLSPGRPLKPMLAHPTSGIDVVLDRFDKNAFTCEYKYDGERAQIHKTESGEVKIFSRNQEDNTSKYPDIISRLSNAVKESTKSFILDSEAVAWDKGCKQILPFQVLSTRKRKDAVESEIVVQVCIMAFDLLYLNGESLIKKPLKERRSLLHSSFNEVENEFMFAQYKDGNSAETMQEFLNESVKGNCEGLMVKALEVDASYEIAKRSHNWLKLKKDYLQGVGDTLDLVVIGGYFGKGKRTGTYGGFLLACYDDDNEEFQSICKLGTGFKDDDLEAHTTFLKQHVITAPKSYYRYDHSLEPDVWFEAVQVWEIKCADLSISPVHKAAVGIVDPEKGISLRFPRFIRIRDDKNIENATSSAQVVAMYQNQKQIQNTSTKNATVEEEFY